MATAHAASSGSLSQVLPPIATVVAAIAGALITGFGAARLKHKWDVEADDRRWRQDSDSRNRSRRLDAFAHYLSARPDLRVARAFALRTADPSAVVSDIRLAAANLLILLPHPNQRDIVERDLQMVEGWIDLWLESPAEARQRDVPTAQPILDLARDLVVEDGL